MTSAPSARAALAPWLVGACLVGGVVLVTVLVVAGGAPRPAPGGLPDAGPLTGWGLPVVHLLVDLAGFATVGLALVGSRIVPVGATAADEVARVALRVAAVWAGLAGLEALLQASELQAVPLLSADPSVWGDLVTALLGTTESQATLVQAALAAGTAVLCARGSTPARTGVALVLAVAAFVPAALVGHAGGDLFGSVSLVIHIGAAALWVGGLAALAWVALRARIPLSEALPRYSALALGCVVTVAASGIINAAVRVPSVDALVQSSYGRLVLAKATALAVLVGFGWLQRRHTVARLRRSRDHGPGLRRVIPVFVAIAGVELVVMVATVALAAGLARTPPPTSETPGASVQAPSVRR